MRRVSYFLLAKWLGGGFLGGMSPSLSSVAAFSRDTYGDEEDEEEGRPHHSLLKQGRHLDCSLQRGKGAKCLQEISPASHTRISGLNNTPLPPPPPPPRAFLLAGAPRELIE